MKKFIYLILILGLTILISFFGIKLYKEKFIQVDTNIFLEKPYSQIAVSELENYLTENSDFIIYLNNLKSEKEFQDYLASYILNNNLYSKFLFVDSRDLNTTATKYLKSIYKGKIPFETINLNNDVVFKVGERLISDYLELKPEKTVENLNSFLTKYEAIND